MDIIVYPDPFSFPMSYDITEAEDWEREAASRQRDVQGQRRGRRQQRRLQQQQQRPAVEPLQGNAPVDIYDNDNEYVIVMDAPGFLNEQVHVQEHQGVLVVRGRRHDYRHLQKQHRRVINSERSVSHVIARSFALPDNVEVDRISAKLDHGVLAVRIPKAAPHAIPEAPRQFKVVG